MRTASPLSCSQSSSSSFLALTTDLPYTLPTSLQASPAHPNSRLHRSILALTLLQPPTSPPTQPPHTLFFYRDDPACLHLEEPRRFSAAQPSHAPSLNFTLCTTSTTGSRRRFTPQPELSFRRSLEPCWHIAVRPRYIDCAFPPASTSLDPMPRLATSSNYTRSNYSPDRAGTSTSTSTPATSRASTPQLQANINRRASAKPRYSRPEAQPEDWHFLLSVPLDHSNNPTQNSSVHIAQSYTYPIGEISFQIENPPPAMGGNRTSLSMNGGLDPKRRSTSYDEQYQYKDNAYNTARERVHRESPIIAELRTNVIVSINVPHRFLAHN